MAEDLKTDEARQGRKGTNVLMILIGALVLCVIVFVGLGFYGAVLPDATLESGGTAAGIPSGTEEQPTDDVLVTPEESESGGATPDNATPVPQ